MHLYHFCPFVQGWCPVCDSEVGIEDEILVLAPGSAIRTEGSFWSFIGEGEDRESPLVLHKECAHRWLQLAFSEEAALGTRDLTAPDRNGRVEET